MRRCFDWALTQERASGSLIRKRPTVYGGPSPTWPRRDLGIRVSELAELLNLEINTARVLAKRAVRDDGAVIEFDQV